ncbi:MAG: iron ABC transporter permease [Actinomycetia bacterium]|nr:iron ABC transporter permease [Actinomycetes bacterium]
MAVAFLGYLFLYPLARILGLSLGVEGAGSAFGEVLSNPGLRKALWFSVWQSAASVALTLVAAAPITWAVSRFRFPGRALAKALVTAPFVLPTVVVASAFLSLGIGGSVWAILAAHVFYNVAVVVRTVGGVWARIDRSLFDAARILGASPRQVFWSLTLPLLRPALAASSAIVFLFTFTSFGVVLILGGLRYRTLEVEIWQQTVVFLNLPAAAALAILQLVGVTAVLAWYTRYQERQSVGLELAAEDRNLQRPVTLGQRLSVGVTVGGTLAALSVPLVMLVARSLHSGGAGWLYLLDPGPLAVTPGRAMVNSLLYALATALVAVTVGLCASTVIISGKGRAARWFDVVLMLPLGASAVTVGFGMLVALDWPVDLRATVVLVPLAHALVATPFVVRIVTPILRSVRAGLREAAAVLGASPWRVFREIDLPIAARATAVGAGFAAAVSLGEFGATAFIARPDTITVPALIFRLLGRPGAVSYTGAMAMAVVLALMVTLLIMLIDRVRLGELGSF